MRLLIVGAGRMGRALAVQAEATGDTVVGLVTRAENQAGCGLARQRLVDVDVVLEFTTPTAAPDNLLALAAAGARVVCGTTGWEAHRPAVDAAFQRHGGALLAAENFSFGIYLMEQAVRAVFRSANVWPEVEAHLVDRHHRAKRDTPSGTALRLQRAAMAEAPDRVVPITSIRIGANPGEHDLVFDSPEETLALRHLVRDRRVFARGALAAARWLQGREGLYTFDALFTSTEGSLR